MSELKDLPGETSNNFLARVREEMQILRGRRGDKLDRAITLRDLLDSGLAVLRSGAPVPIGSGGLPLIPAPGVGPYEVDLTPPPTPTGFEVDAAISNLFVSHDAPSYRQGNGHLRTHVYGKTVLPGDPLPTFDSAVEIHQFSGSVTSIATNPATTWRLWIKWETNDGVLSADPAGGTNGLQTRTGEDVSLLLTALTGKIKESELFSSLGTRIDLIDGTNAGSVNARILVEATARETEDLANATATLTLAASVNNPTTGLASRASTSELTSAIATEQSARASAITTVQSAVTTAQGAANTATSSVQIEATTRATQTGQLYAQYTVKVDVNGYVAGYGLASTLNNGVPTSEFIIRADQFAIAPVATDNTAADGSPFFHRTTTTTINGVSVPAGTYMKGAFIHDATITNAKIANLAVDNAKIANLSADKLTAGSIAVGQHIQSASYIAGQQGWRISGSGAAEFSQVTVRGTVFASQGAIGGIAIGASFMRSTNYVANTSGWRLDSSGTAEFASASIRGQLTADQIDTRGLTIRDASNNIIFGSGNSLDFSRISGAGKPANNATANQSDSTTNNAINTAATTSTWSGVTGAGRPDNNATLGALFDVNVFLTGHGILKGSQFVNVLSKIGTGNIASFMDGAAITNAYIGNAAISTLSVAGGAVTTTNFSSGGAGPHSASSTTNLCDVYVDMGSSVIAGSGVVLWGTTVYGTNESPGASQALIIRKISNGQQLASVSQAFFPGMPMSFGVNAFDPNPSPGVNGYRLSIVNPPSGNAGANKKGDIQGSSLIATGGKR